MKAKTEDPKKEIFNEEMKNIETISSEEENSDKNDENDSPKNNIASFITTPYERVLSIINEAKAFILSVSSTQQNLIDGLEWAIKIISSHNLYTYELKDHEETEDFKQFVQFVNSYNDVIPLNKKPSGKKSFLVSSLNLKRPTTFKYSLNKIEEEKQQDEREDKDDKKRNIKDNPININKNIVNIDTNNKNKEDKNKNGNKNNINNTGGANKKSEKKNNIKSKFIKGNTNTKSCNQNTLRNIQKKMLSKLEKSENSKTQKSAKINTDNNIIPKSEKKKPLSPIRQIKKTINNINLVKSAINLLPKTEILSKKINSSKSIPKNNIIQKEFSQKSTKVIKPFNRMKSENLGKKSFNFLKDDKAINSENGYLNRSFSKYSSNLMRKHLTFLN